MQNEYIIKRKVIFNGRIYNKGEKVKVKDEIAEKFPEIFEKIKSVFKKSKKKKNDRNC